MTDSSPAAQNIRPELNSNSISLSNEGFNTSSIVHISPDSQNLSSNVLSGNQIWRVQLPQGMFSDPTKWLIHTRYSLTITTDDLGLNPTYPITESLYSSGTLRINGVHHKDTNDFTQSAHLTNRLSYGALHNAAHFGYDTDAIADAASGALAETYYEETFPIMSVFTLNHSEMIAPPSSVWEFIFNVDGTQANYTTKLLEGKCSADASGAVPTNFAIKIYQQWLEVPQYRSESPLDSTYIIKFIEPSIYSRKADTTPLEQNFGISGNPVLVGCFFQDTRTNSLAATDTANDYAIAASRFKYGASNLTSLLPADGATTTGVTAGSPLTIQFSVGNHLIPQTAFDHNWGMYGAYNTCLYHGYNSANKDRIMEGYAAWINQGPIWIMPVVIDEAEDIRDIVARVTFKTSVPASANMNVFIFRQRIVKIEYDTTTGMPVSTTISA